VIVDSNVLVSGRRGNFYHATGFGQYTGLAVLFHHERSIGPVLWAGIAAWALCCCRPWWAPIWSIGRRGRLAGGRFADSYDDAEYQADLTHQRMLQLGPPIAAP
jgi:hypothetical protein